MIEDIEARTYSSCSCSFRLHPMDCSDKSDASPHVASILHHRRAFPSRPQIQSLRYNQLSYSF